MIFMNWYRIVRPFNHYGPTNVGRIVQAEGTSRMAALESMGFVEQVSELGSEMVQVREAEPKKNTEPPVGTTRPRRVRRGKTEAEPAGGEDVRSEPGDVARGEDGPADRDSSEEVGTGS